MPSLSCPSGPAASVMWSPLSWLRAASPVSSPAYSTASAARSIKKFGDACPATRPGWQKVLGSGVANGGVWSPGMVDVPLRGENKVHNATTRRPGGKSWLGASRSATNASSSSRQRKCRPCGRKSISPKPRRMFANWPRAATGSRVTRSDYNGGLASRPDARSCPVADRCKKEESP